MKAVIFDLDGTIVFSHSIHFRAYEKLFDEFGIKWSFEEFNDLFAGTGAPSIIGHVLTTNGIKDFDAKALSQKKRGYFQKILKDQRLRVVDGFFDFIKKINSMRLKKAIASGSHKDNIIDMLNNIGLTDEFAEILSGEEVSNPKPAPDIFLAAAQRLNEPASECVVFEDTIQGVSGAKAAKMKCIALRTTSEKEKLLSAGADAVFSDYTQIDIDKL